MDNCWSWKNSIGPLEQRHGDIRNRWRYKNNLYFGLDEYLHLCEDLETEPVYTTSSGSEATMRLIRASRGNNGKNEIFRVEGHFQGYHEMIYIGGQPPQSEFQRNRKNP